MDLGGWGGGVVIAVVNIKCDVEFFCVKRESQNKTEANKKLPGLREGITPLSGNQIARDIRPHFH